jgi:hypothetical protein
VRKNLLSDSVKERGQVEDLGIDGRIILGWMLGHYDGRL